MLIPTSQRSYTRTKGWVSLFDLRGTSEEDIKAALGNFYFLNPSSTGNNPIFLFISPSTCSKLIAWSRARDEGAWEKALSFIPKVECFYPGDIPVKEIYKIISVAIEP